VASVAKANGDTRLFAIAGDLITANPNGSFHHTPVGTVSEWLPGTNRWVNRKDAPYVWHQEHARPHAAVIGSKVYIPGGFIRCGNCAIPRDSMAVYDAAANTWTTVRPPQIATGSLTWALDGKLYWAGKCDDDDTGIEDQDLTVCTDTGARPLFLLRYNPANGNWVYLKAPPHPVAGVPGTIGGKLYAAAENVTDVYDPATNRWSTGRTEPLSGDYVLGGGAVGARLYVVLSQENPSTPATATFAYDAASDQWSSRAPLPDPFAPNFDGMRGARVVVGGQLRLAVVGGFGAHWQYTP
jgi:hypothetical protein